MRRGRRPRAAAFGDKNEPIGHLLIGSRMIGLNSRRVRRMLEQTETLDLDRLSAARIEGLREMMTSNVWYESGAGVPKSEFVQRLLRRAVRQGHAIRARPGPYSAPDSRHAPALPRCARGDHPLDRRALDRATDASE